MKKWFASQPTLSWQLLARCALALLLGTLITEGVAYEYVRRGLAAQIQSRALAIAQGLEFSTESLLEPTRNSTLQRVLDNYATLPAVIEVAIIDPDLKVLAYGSLYFQDKRLRWLQESDTVVRLLESSNRGVAVTLERQVIGRDAIIKILPFSSTLFAQAGRRGLAIAVIDKAQVNQDALSLWIMSTVIMSGGILLVLAIIARLIHRLVHEPIQSLNHQVAVSQECGSFQIPPGLPRNEILYLAETFDQVFQAKQSTYEQLKLSHEDLARATRLKDEFLANMSHELRTPLNVILGMSEAFKDGIYGSLNSRQIAAMQMIYQHGEHLLALISDILDLAKIQAGKVDLQIESVCVQELCDSTLTMVKHLAQKKYIDLNLELSEINHSTYIHIDKRRIRQVLMNLLSNAIKFTPDYGTVTLKTALNPLHTSLYLEVIDTGIGISPENLDLIFDPFVQVDGQFNRQYSGTGLGLTLVSQLTEMHGGTVEVQSTEGQGSCFRVILPLVQTSAAIEQEQPSSIYAVVAGDQPQTALKLPTQDEGNEVNEVNQHPIKPNLQPALSTAPVILLMDSNWANQESLSEYLSIQGYQLLCAQAEGQCLQLLKAHPVDLLVLSLSEPESPELKLLHELRNSAQYQHLPVIIIGTVALSEHQDRSLQVDKIVYLERPLQLRQLLATVQEILT